MMPQPDSTHGKETTLPKIPQEETPAHPWLSNLMFCIGFIVGFSMCFFAISYFRGIPHAELLHRLATFYSAPAADSDPGRSGYPPAPSRRPLYSAAANQKVPCSRSFRCGSGIMLLVCSPSDRNVSEEREKPHRLSMAAFATFHRRYSRFLRASNRCVVLGKLRRTLLQDGKHPVLIFGWGFRTCDGRGYVPSQHQAPRPVEALQNHSCLEFIQVGCCL